MSLILEPSRYGKQTSPKALEALSSGWPSPTGAQCLKAPTGTDDFAHLGRVEAWTSAAPSLRPLSQGAIDNISLYIYIYVCVYIVYIYIYIHMYLYMHQCIDLA